MLDVAIRKPDGEVVADLTRRRPPPLPVTPTLAPLLPHGLRRGSTVELSGSLSLLLALLGTASTAGAWCALIGLPPISTDAAVGYGIQLDRLAIIPAPAQGWATALGALLDALDVVVTRVPARASDGDIRRIAARARTRDAVLMPYASNPGQRWPGAEVRLHAQGGIWAGIGAGTGRLRQRRVTVTASGRGAAGREQQLNLLLPNNTGEATPLLDVVRFSTWVMENPTKSAALPCA